MVGDVDTSDCDVGDVDTPDCDVAGTLQLHGDNWYTKVTDLLEKQQTAPIWMSDTKVRLY